MKGPGSLVQQPASSSEGPDALSEFASLLTPTGRKWAETSDRVKILLAAKRQGGAGGTVTSEGSSSVLATVSLAPATVPPNENTAEENNLSTGRLETGSRSVHVFRKT